MRKFTKEITALIATVAVGAATGASTLAQAETPPIGGLALVDGDINLEVPTEEEMPPVAGGLALVDGDINLEVPTEEEMPPMAGDPLPSDEWIEPTTEEELPPLGGVPMPSDEWIEPTTEEELPPMAGEPLPADGDINTDGIFDTTDVVQFQRWLLNDPDVSLGGYWPCADLCADGTLDVYDLSLMKKKLIEKQNQS